MEALWATILFSGFALEVIIRPLKKALDPYLFTKIMDDYLTNIRDRITDTYDGKRDRHIMIRGINQFAD